MLHQRGPHREMHFGKRRNVHVGVIFWKVQDLSLRHRAVFGVPTTDDQTTDRIIDCEAGDPIADGGHLTRELDPGHISDAVEGFVLGRCIISTRLTPIVWVRISTSPGAGSGRDRRASGMTSAPQRTSISMTFISVMIAPGTPRQRLTDVVEYCRWLLNMDCLCRRPRRYA